MSDDVNDTAASAYTRRLLTQESAPWKRLLQAQAPYRWNLNRLRPGFMLDVGCGVGRNLSHVNGHGIGIDHNADSVAVCRDRGFEAYIPEEFNALRQTKVLVFDSLLFSHVLEHMPFNDARDLVAEYLPLVRPSGKVIFITPQELGYKSDPTHVYLFTEPSLRDLTGALGLDDTNVSSFPFPSPFFGKLFRYNEFVTVSTRR